MTDIQFAQSTVEELFKDMPFNLDFSVSQTRSLYNIFSQSDSDCEFIKRTAEMTWEAVKNGNAIRFEVNRENVDKFYHVLTLYSGDV